MQVCASPPPGPAGGVCTGHRRWPPGSRIIVGVFENCCRITCRRLVGRHPSNVGVPRMRSNASWSGGAGTTVSCGATQSFTEAIKAVFPQARFQADHFHTVKNIWGHLKKSLLSYRRHIKANGEENNDENCKERAKCRLSNNFSCLTH